MVFACSPELAKEIYTAGDDVLVAGEAKIAVFGKILGSSSSLLLDGPEHLKRRRLMLPRFRGEVVEALEPVIAEACRKTLDAMPVEVPFALHPFMHRIAFEVISCALFSATPIERRHPLTEALRDFAHRAVTSRLLMFPALQRDFGAASPWGRVVRAVERARAMVRDELQVRGNAKASDLTGLLMAARHDDGSPLDEAEIVDEILTMIAAGHETTSMALAWLCYAVFSRPEVRERLLSETGDLAARPYLDAVVRESLRFHSVIPNGSGRIAKRAFQLSGYEVPAGAMVSIAFHAVHRRANVFERPDEFWPERFLDAPSARKYTPYESIAFGGGTRRCLGMPFALFEIKLVLATLLARYDLEIMQRDVRPVWRGRFLTPSKGLVVRIRDSTRAARA
jgi:cytochrome P450